MKEDTYWDSDPWDLFLDTSSTIPRAPISFLLLWRGVVVKIIAYVKGAVPGIPYLINKAKSDHRGGWTLQQNTLILLTPLLSSASLPASTNLFNSSTTIFHMGYHLHSIITINVDTHTSSSRCKWRCQLSNMYSCPVTEGEGGVWRWLQ